jgi:hypothetical protein
VHKVDFDGIRKTPEGCLSLALPSKVILMLLEFQLNVNEEPYVAVKFVLSSSSVCQIDVSEV